MNYRYAAALLGCLLGAGCAGPLDRTWDDTTYRSINERFAASDAHRAGLQANDDASQAVTTGMESLSVLMLDDAIRIGIANTPSLRRAGYEVDIAAGMVTQAGLYPNPSIAFEAEALGSDAGSGGETSYRIEQQFLLGGKLRHARGVAQQEQLAAQVRFLAEEFAVASRITRSYYAALSTQARLESRQELLSLSQELMDAARAQVDAGAATVPDQLRAEVVNEQAQIELATAQLEAQSALRGLATSMGLAEPFELPLGTDMVHVLALGSQEEITNQALNSNNRIILARIEMERSQRAHDLARANSVPDLVASAGPRYSDPDNETTFDVGIGLEIPLFDRNQGAIRAAIAKRRASAAQLQDEQLGVIQEVSRAWAAYESARIASTRYRNNLLPKAEQTLDLTRQAYQRGKADYLRLLDAQQVVIESSIAHVDAIQSMHEAASRLRELAQSDAPWRASSTPHNERGKGTS